MNMEENRGHLPAARPLTGPTLDPAAMNTPGVGGYILAIVVSWIAFLLILLMLAAPSTEIERVRLDGILWMATFVAIVGTPVGFVGAAIVHLACRHEPRQWVHVLVAGGSAFLIQEGFAVFVHAPVRALLSAPLMIVMLPMILAAMVGRAMVIPLVPRPTVHSPSVNLPTHNPVR